MPVPYLPHDQLHLHAYFLRHLWKRTLLNLLFRTSAALGLVVVSVIALQLAYPTDRALPLTHLENGQWVGFKSEEDISASLRPLNQTDTLITVDKSRTSQQLSDLGVAVDPDTTATVLTSYSWQERLIPFS